MTNLETRLAKLERAQGRVELPPIRIFTCRGDAEDGGANFADSPRPANTPPGYIWAMWICGCAREGLTSCRYRDQERKYFTIDIDRASSQDDVE